MARTQPVESKVAAATLGTGAGAVVSTFVIWGLDELFWNGAASPDVPLPVVGIVTLAITSLVTFLAGYNAKHTPRAGDVAAR